MTVVLLRPETIDLTGDDSDEPQTPPGAEVEIDVLSDSDSDRPREKRQKTTLVSMVTSLCT